MVLSLNRTKYRRLANHYASTYTSSEQPYRRVAVDGEEIWIYVHSYENTHLYLDLTLNMRKQEPANSNSILLSDGYKQKSSRSKLIASDKQGSLYISVIAGPIEVREKHSYVSALFWLYLSLPQPLNRYMI